MAHLNAILIGCDESLRQQVKIALEVAAIYFEGELSHLGLLEWLEKEEAKWQEGSKLQKKERLFIIHLRSGEDLTDLVLLRNLFVGQPILVLLDAETKQADLIRVMREGASQVVVLPFQEDDFKAALDSITLQMGKGDFKLIAVTGVSGGNGATTIAINLAYEIAERHQTDCILTELSLQKGDLATYLNVEPEITLHDVFRDIHHLDQYSIQKALTPVTEHLNLLPAPHQSIDPMDVAPIDVLRFLGHLRRTSAIIVVDVPPTFDDRYFKVLAGADAVVLVAQQRVPTIRALSLTYEALKRQDSAGKYYPVVNRYNPKIKGFTSVELGKLLEVPHIWTVVDDAPAVTDAVNKGKPLRLQAPRSHALTDIVSLSESILKSDRPGATHVSFLGKVAKALGL